jgi:hypothetical protein
MRIAVAVQRLENSKKLQLVNTDKNFLIFAGLGCYHTGDYEQYDPLGCNTV